MEILIAWALFASVQLAATMSPGPAFVISTRTAIMHGRMQSIYNALGLALGVGAHVIFVLLGLSFLITKSVILYAIVKYVGAAYLVYLGSKSLYSAYKARKEKHYKTQKLSSENPLPDNIQFKRKAPWHFVLTGFLTNLLNPKAVVFFTAVYTQFITPGMPMEIMALYGMTSVFVEGVWFSIVGIVLTNPKIKEMFKRAMVWVETICGGLMIALGVRLILSKT